MFSPGQTATLYFRKHSKTIDDFNSKHRNNRKRLEFRVWIQTGFQRFQNPVSYLHFTPHLIVLSGPAPDMFSGEFIPYLVCYSYYFF